MPRPPRRNRRFSWRRRSPLLVIVVLLLLFLLRRGQLLEEFPPAPIAEGEYRVERVIDGDTLLLTNGQRVRLIGVDTPETVHPDRPVEPFGREATEFTREAIASAGNVVRLQLDRQRLDKYDRVLAYVWVGDQLLNEELIRAGLGRAQPQYSYWSTMKNRFLKAEEEAKAQRKGIWSLKERSSQRRIAGYDRVVSLWPKSASAAGNSPIHPCSTAWQRTMCPWRSVISGEVCRHTSRAIGQRG